MANEFEDNRVKFSQLKSNFTNKQKVQRSSMSSLPGVGSGRARNNSVNTIDKTGDSLLEVGARVSGQLESDGFNAGVVRKFLNNKVYPSVSQKRSLDKNHPVGFGDSKDIKKRLPNSNKKTVAEKIQSSKESLVGVADHSYEGLQFPADLMNNAHVVMKLSFFDYRRNSPFTAGEIGEPKDYIYLPMPENFTQTHAVSYTPQDTGIIQEVMSHLRNTGGEMNVNSENIASVPGKLVRAGVDLSGSAVKRTAFAGLDGAESILGGQNLPVASVAGAMMGMIPNPHPTIFFKGMPLRTFDWEWRFVPRNPADAENLSIILKKLRQNILPGGSSTFLEYPMIVLPEVMTKRDSGDLVEDTSMAKFLRSQVSQFNINYTGEGTSAWFRDGKPVSIRVQMQFTEVEMFTKEKAE